MAKLRLNNWPSRFQLANNNFARTSHFAVTVQLRRESALFHFCAEDVNTRQLSAFFFLNLHTVQNSTTEKVIFDQLNEME